ncbi:SAM-dependent methyltransferase [Streptomyces sp. NBC_01497]|uniref:SAM-dependent methyltransferase n=1 Tax=Streptomyces sp. NBC_01497 TaxID=2903885 RepID=UPI002E333548|nr:SAM-dependent methyltransferase [Streptomyces sp. NBC_01497]
MRKGRARGWREATEDALYGPGGFYLRSRPAAHFRTSVHASPLFAAAVTRLLAATARALGSPEAAFVDMAAGRGELATAVAEATDVTGPTAGAPRAKGLTGGPGRGGASGTAEATGTAGAADTEGAGGSAGGAGTAGPTDAVGSWAPYGTAVRTYAVERAPAPTGLDPRVAWLAEPPAGVTGLLFANEWLDNVPVDVAETDAEGVPRYVRVRRDGTEEPGAPVTGADARWLARWWPIAGARPGTRAEIGRPRDEAWRRAAGSLTRGLAVAVDYGHVRASRPPYGTLTGFRDGREVRPVPDGGCDLTSHVAMDAIAPGSVRVTQRTALRALGVTGDRPPLALARTDPAGYLRALSDAGEAAELTARGGLGDFTWLLQPVGIDLTDIPELADLAETAELAEPSGPIGPRAPDGAG